MGRRQAWRRMLGCCKHVCMQPLINWCLQTRRLMTTCLHSTLGTPPTASRVCFLSHTKTCAQAYMLLCIPAAQSSPADINVKTAAERPSITSLKQVQHPSILKLGVYSLLKSASQSRKPQTTHHAWCLRSVCQSALPHTAHHAWCAGFRALAQPHSQRQLASRDHKCPAHWPAFKQLASWQQSSAARQHAWRHARWHARRHTCSVLRTPPLSTRTERLRRKRPCALAGVGSDSVHTSRRPACRRGLSAWLNSPSAPVQPYLLSVRRQSCALLSRQHIIGSWLLLAQAAPTATADLGD